MLGNVFLLTVTAQLAVLCLQEGASSSPIHGDMIVLPQKIVANYNGYYLREVVFWCVVKQAPFYMDNPFQVLILHFCTAQILLAHYLEYNYSQFEQLFYHVH